MHTTSNPKLILVPTDFGETAGHALRYASALAMRLDAHLLVVHGDVFIPAVDFMATAAAEFAIAHESLVTGARERLLQHAEENIDPRVPFDTRVVVDAPVNAILGTARETAAQLIVMGTHGRSGVSRLLLGSVTETIMRTAPVPVLAVNNASPDAGNIRKILCPVTYSTACVTALRNAAALVNARSTPIVLLRTIDEASDVRDRTDELMRLQEWVPRELVDRCELKIVPLQSSAEFIVTLANEINPDLIVFGIAANRTFADVLRGTVAERVMQHAHCPLLTVAAQPVVAEAAHDAVLVVERVY
jgi:nucleotide-binding universal stress UspA family protein